MTIPLALQAIRDDASLAANLAWWKTLPAQPGQSAPFPAWLHPELAAVLARRGIEHLWSHQALAAELAHRGENVVIATPTASGKTLGYNLPVLQALLENREARALYLFPTKALSRDQVRELEDLAAGLSDPPRVGTYDGDTPTSARPRLRGTVRVLATNPDMLHAGILPHHPSWAAFFRNLSFVVVDEVHQYRGVFGGHVANVLRRLARVCRFHGSRPRFLASSATIANPAELAAAIIGEEVSLVDAGGAPGGRRHFLFYNPPLVDRERGIRANPLGEAARLAEKFMAADVQCILFARSRLQTEILLGYLRESQRRAGRDPEQVRGYRGGYLPAERRRIETGLKEGSIRAVVSTNALELGIDIGTLDASILVGYPGSIASAWQQAGRAGRRTAESAAVLVAGSSPLDQFMVKNPLYFFGRSPEHGVIDPDNLLLLLAHLRCAAFELPLGPGESFGRHPLPELLDFLAEEGSLHPSGDRWHWVGEGYPADEVSLRSVQGGTVSVRDRSAGGTTIGTVDAAGAPFLLHPEAIYLQDGRTYLVTALDLESGLAEVEPASVDWFTEAQAETSLIVAGELESGRGPVWSSGHGEVEVTSRVTSFRRIRTFTNEQLGGGELDLPARLIRTTSFWLVVEEEAAARLADEPASPLQAWPGLAALLLNTAPLFIMADPRDLRALAQIRSAFHDLPALFIYDNLPGGAGYSRALYRLIGEILEAARLTLRECPCAAGCPSCIGPPNPGGGGVKEPAGRLLDILLEQTG